jgi:DNA replication protein DnaC
LRAAPKRSGEYHFSPGEEMQHDTSPHRVVIDGKTLTAQCAALALAYSRRLFVRYYLRFTRLEAKHFLLQAAQFMDGVASRCVIDNTSVVVVGGAGAEAVFAPEMVAFAATLGFKFMAHRVNDPNRKSRIERPFYFVQTNFLPGRTFADLDDLNAQALHWCVEVANAKPKRSLGMASEAAFATEASCLRKLPAVLPPVYEVLDRVVDLYGFVSVDTNRYSVPERLVGKTVTAYKHYERIQVHYRGTVVASHERAICAGRCLGITLSRSAHRASRRWPSSSCARSPRCCSTTRRRSSSTTRMAAACARCTGWCSSGEPTRASPCWPRWSRRSNSACSTSRGWSTWCCGTWRATSSRCPVKMKTATREQLHALLAELNLKGMARTLDAELDRAQAQGEPAADVLHRLLTEQAAFQRERRLVYRVAQARLPWPWTLDTFPFARQPGVDRAQVRALAGLDFVRRAQNIVLIGPTGTGKSGIAIGLLRQACLNGYTGRFYNAQELFDELYASLADRTTTKLLKAMSRMRPIVIDELGYLTLKPEQVNAFFRLMEQRYGRVSTIITTNLAYDAWYDMFGNKPLVDALLDRLRHQCITIRIDGPSLREPAPEASPLPAKSTSSTNAASRAKKSSDKPA